MTVSAKLATLVATGSLLLTGSQAFAASAMTDAFVANVRPNVDFLNDSSRLAINKSPSAGLRRFARSEATQQTITGNSLVAWAQTNTTRGEAVALGEPLAPIGGLVAAPLDFATGVTGNVVAGVDDVVTDRSVALDQPSPLVVTPAAPAAGTPVTGGALLPSQQTDMARLRSVSGRQFDALYRSTQLDALHQLATLYRSYIENGDDPGLRDIAVHQLPEINRRILELGRI